MGDEQKLAREGGEGEMGGKERSGKEGTPTSLPALPGDSRVCLPATFPLRLSSLGGLQPGRAAAPAQLRRGSECWEGSRACFAERARSSLLQNAFFLLSLPLSSSEQKAPPYPGGSVRLFFKSENGYLLSEPLLIFILVALQASK